MLRGIYCRDTRYSKFLGGRLTGGSPNVVGHPGENAILIESDVADYSSEGLLFKSIYSDRSGEHGFRVGGQNIVRDVLHVGCTSKRHGSGLIPGEIEDGGSGFKVLGPTSRDNIYHSNISYDNCSAVSANYQDDSGANFAGFQIGKVEDSFITNCQVYADEDALGGFADHRGIEIIGCRRLTVDSFRASNTVGEGIYLYTFGGIAGQFWQFNNDININGPVLSNCGRAAVHALNDFTGQLLISIRAARITSCPIGLKITPGSNFVQCTFDADIAAGSGANALTQLFENAGQWLISGRGEWRGPRTAAEGAGNEASPDSVFHDWNTSSRRIYRGGDWLQIAA